MNDVMEPATMQHAIAWILTASSLVLSLSAAALGVLGRLRASQMALCLVLTGLVLRWMLAAVASGHVWHTDVTTIAAVAVVAGIAARIIRRVLRRQREGLLRLALVLGASSLLIPVWTAGTNRWGPEAVVLMAATLLSLLAALLSIDQGAWLAD